MSAEPAISDEQLDDYLDGEVLDEFEAPKAEPEDEFMRVMQEEMQKLLQEQPKLDDFKDKMVDWQQDQEPQDFQSKISKTMSKLQQSSEKVEQLIEKDINIPDPMEKMMKELEGLVESGDFDAAFGNIMKEIVSKDLLYEPMKDLAQKYPEWLEKNKDTLETTEYTRYQDQHKVIISIVQVFESTEGDELSQENHAKVTDLMQQMQSFGNPPDGLLQELAPGMDAAEGLDAPPPECKNM